MLAAERLAGSHADEVVDTVNRQHFGKLWTGSKNLAVLVQHENVAAEALEHRPHDRVIHYPRNLRRHRLR